METLLLDWLSLILRWLHVITAIAWIGASFYFVWLDNSLESPPQWKKDKGVSGDLWAFHGGGIYEVGKYQLAPQAMPQTLHWFKWEAYSTWITGALLLFAVYYLRADLYLAAPGKWVTSPAVAVATSIAFLAAGVVIYEVLVRTLLPRRQPLFLGLLVLTIAFSCWLAPQLFAERAAFLHVGAMLASIMAANVLLGIIPAQKGFIKAIEAEAEPDRNAMLMAKTRSVHNNYFTLPVLLCMVSNHYPFLYGHSLNWVLLIVLIAATAYARHFFNLRHKGVIRPQILWVSGGVTAAVILFMGWSQAAGLKAIAPDQGSAEAPALEAGAAGGQGELAAGAVEDAGGIIAAGGSDAGATGVPMQHERLLSLSQTHCTGCHAAAPTTPGFNAPPAGIMMETVEQIRAARAQATAAVQTQYMPLANMTQMTPAERTEFIALMQQL